MPRRIRAHYSSVFRRMDSAGGSGHGTYNGARSQAEIHRVPRINVKAGSITDVIQGPGTDKLREEFDQKSEEQLIQMAGPVTPSKETKTNAAFRLETLVTSSKNRIDLYLLALNDFEDGSGEYKGAVYQSIYGAELARSRGQ